MQKLQVQFRNYTNEVQKKPAVCQIPRYRLHQTQGDAVQFTEGYGPNMVTVVFGVHLTTYSKG